MQCSEEKANTTAAEDSGPEPLAKQPALFPILPATAAPTGIARLAAQATHADDGHQVEFRALEARSILNHSVSRRLPWLAYSINPYRGCEFACRYCYARYTHEFLEPAPTPASGPPKPLPSQPCTLQSGSLAPQAGLLAPRSESVTPQSESPVPQPWATAFEHTIYLKQNAAWLLEQELRKIDPAQEIALGTATDPYQPIERRTRITRSLLEVFARRSGFRLGIVTKSPLITRDLDLLTQIAERNTLVLHLTITTPDADLARLLEPRAPRPDLRFEAVRTLRSAGLTTGVLCSPLLPGLTDTESALDHMAARSAQVGASFFAAQPLFLKSCSRPTFLSFLREHFPALEADYLARFRDTDFAAPPYRRHLAALVEAVCRRHGLGQRFSEDVLLPRDPEAPPAPGAPASPRKPAARARNPAQQSLFA
jgi:DNA repair photolyase